MAKDISDVVNHGTTKPVIYKKSLRLIFLAFIYIQIFPLRLCLAQESHTTRLIEGAKKEGAVMWYTSMSGADAKKMTDAFTKKHPFIKMEFFRAASGTVLSRMLSEARAGTHLLDVASVSGFETYQMAKSLLLQPYVSPESRTYPEMFKDAKGYWTDYFDSYVVIGYNTKLIPKGQNPKDWEALLDSKWKGKLTRGSDDVGWYATMLDRWGDEKGRKFMKALAKQEMPARTGGSTLIAQLVAAGETPMGMVQAHTIESLKGRGAPVDWITTTDPIVVSLHPMGLATKPPHPNAGKLFIDFVLSQEGQKVIIDMGRTSPRPGMDPRSEGSNLKLFPTRPELADRYSEYEKEFRQVFGYR